MALTLGTNCGFVSSAPSSDPSASSQRFETNALAVKHTTPADATKVTEIGVWIDNATEAADITLGIYTHDSGNNEPDELLGSATIAKGTSGGLWKSMSVNIAVSGSTTYWVAAQCDTTSTITKTNYGSGSSNHTIKYSQTTLTDPWGSSDNTWSELGAYYAVYSTETGTNMKINISDSWKDIESMKINIGDAWKDVSAVKINVGDAWKDVY